MPRVSLCFFLVAALTAIVGMVWGSYMGVTGDHSLHPAHAHLNLLGWVTLSIMGTFYALPGVRFNAALAWANLLLSATGAILMSVLLPQVLTGKLPGQIMMASEAPVILGMVIFLAAILGNFRKA
jgi:hypothetical protein